MGGLVINNIDVGQGQSIAADVSAMLGDVFIAFDELTTLSGLNLAAGGDLFA